MSQPSEPTNGNIFEGRPDFENHKFGRTRAKRHPKYVYGNANGLLMHEIGYVEFCWYEVLPPGHCLIRLDHPRINIHTCCGQMFFLWHRNGQPRSTMCEIPEPHAVLCGRCQGKGPVFGKDGNWIVTKKEAKARLACTEVVRL